MWTKVRKHSSLSGFCPGPRPVLHPSLVELCPDDKPTEAPSVGWAGGNCSVWAAAWWSSGPSEPIKLKQTSPSAKSRGDIYLLLRWFVTKNYWPHLSDLAGGRVSAQFNSWINEPVKFESQITVKQLQVVLDFQFDTFIRTELNGTVVPWQRYTLYWALF